MPSFKDARQREWLVALDAPTIRLVRQECHVDLGGTDGSEFNRLAEDPVLLVDVLWVICREQAGKQNLAAEEFGRSLVGDPIDAATAALEQAWHSFFPQRKRSLLLSLSAKNAAIRLKAEELTRAKIDDPELEQRVVAAMEAKLTREVESLLTQLNGPTSSPASSASARPA